MRAARRSPGDLERARQVLEIQIGTAAMFVVGFAAIARYWQLDVPLIVGAVSMTMLGCVGNLLWLHRGGRARAVADSSVAMLFALLVVSVAGSGGFYDPNFAWLYTVPVAGAFLVDQRSGWAWLAVVSLTTVCFWALPDLGIVLPNLVPLEERHTQALFNRMTALAALSILSTCFVVARRRTERDLRASHRDLLQETKSVQLLQHAAVAANEAHTLEVALEQSALRILGSTGWVVAIVWLPAADDSGEFAFYGLSVSGEGARYEPLREVSRLHRVRPGELALGKVISEMRLEWADQGRLAPDQSPRGLCALSLGLGSAVAIPVVSGGKVHAVLEFFSDDWDPVDQRLLRVVQEVGHQIGRVAERIYLQDRLRQAQKLESVGQLAAGIAHEINNPMAYVHANLGMLRREWQLLLDEAQKLAVGEPLSKRLAECEELIDESIEGVDRTVAIVRDVREFSRTSGSRMERADLNELVEASLRIATAKRPPGVEIVRCYGDEAVVSCIPSQLEQVFLNLIVNAFQACGETGVVRVTTEIGSSHAAVTVEDDGPGVSPENISRLFDPFFSTKDAGEGTGLGLYISYEIVRLHGGEINVVSESRQGACFEIRLPVETTLPTG